MSRGQVTWRLAAAFGAVSLFAAHAATAQQQEKPPGSTTYAIHFSTAGSDLDAADQDTIRGIAAAMQRTPTVTATIIGRADTQGSAELNERLSEKRAQTVFEALVNTNKVPEERVEMRFTGEHMPYLSTADQQEEMLNRVVEVILH